MIANAAAERADVEMDSQTDSSLSEEEVVSYAKDHVVSLFP